MLFNFLVGFNFMLCGWNKHTCLAWSNFQILEVTSDKYLVHKKLEIVDLQDQIMHVSIKNPVRWNNMDCLDMVECIENNLSCVTCWFLFTKACVLQHKSIFIVIKHIKNWSMLVQTIIWSLYFIFYRNINKTSWLIYPFLIIWLDIIGLHK